MAKPDVFKQVEPLYIEIAKLLHAADIRGEVFSIQIEGTVYTFTLETS